MAAAGFCEANQRLAGPPLRCVTGTTGTSAMCEAWLAPPRECHATRHRTTDTAALGDGAFVDDNPTSEGITFFETSTDPDFADIGSGTVGQSFSGFIRNPGDGPLDYRGILDEDGLRTQRGRLSTCCGAERPRPRRAHRTHPPVMP